MRHLPRRVRKNAPRKKRDRDNRSKEFQKLLLERAEARRKLRNAKRLRNN